MTGLSFNAKQLLEQRYFLPNETWEQLVKRNVDNILVGDYYEQFKDEIEFIIRERIFLPNSPSLVNAGKKNQGLFACFVTTPEEDTLENGFEILKDIALVAKGGGGNGFSGSFLRPKNSPVAGSAHGYAYGPNRYAEMVSYAMDALTQSGFRKMALMYTLSAEHKDIEEFIHLKQSGDETACYNFNQSVMVTDKWMKKAINPDSVENRLLDRIARSAHKNGEPGLLFETTINEDSPYKYTNQYITATNPCGEQPLPNYGSCNLGSINLNHEYFNEQGYFNCERFNAVIRLAIIHLDATGSANNFPTEKHEEWYKNNRPIGLGLMGLADYYLRYGLTYGDQSEFLVTEFLLNLMKQKSEQTSIELGEHLGVPINCIKYGNETGIYRRNITLLSQAPTGSISIVADCSFGLEPIFSPAFKRTDERGKEYTYIHPKAHEEYFVSAIGEKAPNWKQQIELVSLFQKYMDSGISKTINMPNSATVEDIKNAYVFAWQSKCKGITVYRDGSRQVQVLESLPVETESNQCVTGVCDI